MEGGRKCVMSNQLLGRELGVQMSYIHKTRTIVHVI